MSIAPRDTDLPEWQTARTVLDNFDGRLNDLRKYGFSFVTGLLSVSALFAANTPISVGWKLGVLMSTLFLIVPLDVIDRNYRVFQQAAGIRAQIIEKRSRMALTQTITRMYEDAHILFFFQLVYVIFALATLLLGWLILGTPGSYYLGVLIVFSVTIVVVAGALLWTYWLPRSRYRLYRFTIAAAVVLVITGLTTSLGGLPLDKVSDLWSKIVQGTFFSTQHYHLALLSMVVLAVSSIVFVERTVGGREWVDFGIDGYRYEQGQNVLAVVSNLGKKYLHLGPVGGKDVLTVHKESDWKMEHPVPVEELATEGEIKLGRLWEHSGRINWSQHFWQFSTGKLSPGLYRLVYNGPVYLRTSIWRDKYEPFDPRKSDKEAKKRAQEIERYNRWRDAQPILVRKMEELGSKSRAQQRERRLTRGYKRRLGVYPIHKERLG